LPLALVARKGRCPRVRAAWQRDLGTIDPAPESAVDARDVRRGDMLHQQLAALPTGPAAVRAPVAVFGRAERSWVRHSNRCPWVRQCEPRQPAIGKRPALGDRGASVPGASARSQRPRPKLSESSPDSPMAIPTALRWVCLASLRAERRSACVSSVAWARLSGAARFSAVEPAGHGGPSNFNAARGAPPSDLGGAVSHVVAGAYVSSCSGGGS